METASGRVPEDLYNWLEECGERPDLSKAKVLRQALKDARAVEGGEKLLLELSEREREGITSYADREGLEYGEAAEELLEYGMRVEDATTNGDRILLDPPPSVADRIDEYADRHQAERDAAARLLLRDLERKAEAIDNPTPGTWATITMKQSGWFSLAVVSTAVTFFSTVAFVSLILLEDFFDVGVADVIPAVFFLALLGGILGGMFFAVVGAIGEAIRIYRPGEGGNVARAAAKEANE